MFLHLGQALASPVCSCFRPVMPPCAEERAAPLTVKAFVLDMACRQLRRGSRASPRSRPRRRWQRSRCAAAHQLGCICWQWQLCGFLTAVSPGNRYLETNLSDTMPALSGSCLNIYASKQRRSCLVPAGHEPGAAGVGVAAELHARAGGLAHRPRKDGRDAAGDLCCEIWQ